jgi:hypothetical protein
MTDTRTSFTVPEALATLVRLEGLLGARGVMVQPGGGLERAFLAAANWEYEAHAPTGTTEDARRDTRDVLGAVDFAANILSVEGHPSFDSLVDHLRLLGTGDTSTLPRGRFSAIDCQLYELLVACWAMRASARVALERPTGKKLEDNPDVVATLDGFTVGIAAKAPGSSSSETYFQRLREGAAQTLRRSDDVGRLVAINARSRLPFDGLQPTLGTFGSAIDPPKYGAFLDPSEPPRILAAAMNELNADLATLHESDVKLDLASPMAKIDGWLLSAHVPTTIVAEGLRVVGGQLVRGVGPLPSSAKFAASAQLHPADGRVHAFLSQLAIEANRPLIGRDGVVVLG